MDEIVNHRLRSLWQRRIEYDKNDRNKKFRTQYWCGKSMLRLPGIQHGVAILSNGEKSTIWGLQHCKNSWVCPVCSAINMAKYASDIACAIDALKKWHNEVPFMVTLSTQHILAFSCQQSYQILVKTWQKFYHHGNASKTNLNDPFSAFCSDVKCTHRIRACEFTYGENGWHPHFHCLFFVPKKKLQDVLKWQEKLSDRWYQCMRRAMKEVLKNDNRFPADFVDKNIKRKPFPEFYISVDDKGKVIQINSSRYMCGWGGDAELTKLEFKHASEGHYTPNQMLELADEVDKKGVPVQRNVWLNRYYQLAETTLGKRRVRMSRNLHSIVQKWKRTNDYIKVYKKKVLEMTGGKKYKLVAWFTEEQWSTILWLNQGMKYSITAEILEVARGPNAKQKIEEHMLNYGIDIRNNHPYFNKQLIENLFNHAC